MRRSCEETLRVLRAAQESLATIVEVFIHDPLYKWALSPAAAQLRQAGSQPVRPLAVLHAVLHVPETLNPTP